MTTVSNKSEISKAADPETVYGGDPLVSVIIPVYNAGPYLKETMDSIIGQSFKNVEIICVDDGSTDNSHEILAGYGAADLRVRIIEQKNSGAAAARNTGIRSARGKYLYFADADDLLEPGALELLAAEAERRDLDYLCFKATVFCDDPEVEPLAKSKSGYLVRELDESRVFTGPELLAEWDRNPDSRYNCPVWLCMIRRSYLMENRILFNPDVFFEDELWGLMVLLKAKRAGCLNRCLYRYRIHGDSFVARSADFSLVYSMFKNLQEYYKEVTGDDFVCASQFEDDLLHHRQRFQNNCIRLYRQCSEEEKNKRLLLPLKERWEFETAVVFPAGQSDMLEKTKNDAEKQKKKLENGIKKLSSKNEKLENRNRLLKIESQDALEQIRSSTSYRLGYAITRFPGKIKDFLKAHRKN